MTFQGGCQCGRVRYSTEGPPNYACICYCRMCQKASGGPFMAFVRFTADSLTWSTPPEVFASSNMAERGFCNACGTPMTYRARDSLNLSVTLNSLDDPDAVPPTIAFETERKAAWLAALDGLQTVQDAVPAGFVSHQSP